MAVAAEQQKQKIAMAITQEQIDSLKQKYMLCGHLDRSSKNKIGVQ